MGMTSLTNGALCQKREIVVAFCVSHHHQHLPPQIKRILILSNCEANKIAQWLANNQEEDKEEEEEEEADAGGTSAAMKKKPSTPLKQRSSATNNESPSTSMQPTVALIIAATDLQEALHIIAISPEEACIIPEEEAFQKGDGHGL